MKAEGAGGNSGQAEARPYKARLTVETLPVLQALLADVGVDGWLVYDFKGRNPVAAALLGTGIVGTRRLYAYIPRHGVPVALVHAIDWELWEAGAVAWPAGWARRRWVGRAELAAALTQLVGGRRIVLEYSPHGAIPYLDAVPAGVVEYLRAAGATVVSSVDLVTRFVSVWSAAELASHKRAAQIVAAIAHEAIARAGAAAQTTQPRTEHNLATWIRERFDRAGLVTESGPSISYGANAARNHYDPGPVGSAAIVPSALLLVDLWAKEPGGIYADQTWMAAIGAPSPRDAALWTTVRDARDAALTLLRERVAGGHAVSGAELDRAAHGVVERAGYGSFIESRTGHSIDAFGLHGFGPAVDDTETEDDRVLVPGVGFSVEPGIYIPDEVGVRSEVNVWVGVGHVVVTPGEPQRDLIVV